MSGRHKGGRGVLTITTQQQQQPMAGCVGACATRHTERTTMLVTSPTTTGYIRGVWRAIEQTGPMPVPSHASMGAEMTSKQQQECQCPVARAVDRCADTGS